MLKVLHINDYPPSDAGGAEVLLKRTVELLRPNTEVQLFTADDLPDARLTALRFLDNPIARQALSARLQSWRPDVVHLHNFYHVLSPGILQEIRRYKETHPLRVIMTAHDYHLVCPNAGGNWFRPGARQPFRSIDPSRLGSLGYLLGRRWDQRGRVYSLLKIVQHLWNYRLHDVRSALDVVLCPSRFIEGLVGRLGLATRWLPHPVPKRSSSVSKRVGPLRLVFAGRLTPEKGIAAFLEQLPLDFVGTCSIVGAGPERERCMTICRARSLENRIHFLGQLPHAQTLAEIARAHVLILPSRCLESYGLTLIEALSAGTNILASDRGAMRELVTSAGVGFLFDPTDPTSLAQQLGRIQAEHQAGTLNYFEITNFLAERSEESYVEQLCQLYEGKAA